MENDFPRENKIFRLFFLGDEKPLEKRMLKKEIAGILSLGRVSAIFYFWGKDCSKEDGRAFFQFGERGWNIASLGEGCYNKQV